MASGKKNYFRHNFNARTNRKIKEFMASFGRRGKEGYFYYWTLIELLASQCEEETLTEHIIHTQTLREMWATSTQGVHDVCMKLTSAVLLVCEIRSPYVHFSIPNLPKYLGRYSKQITPNAPKESKEKKRKEKESKEKKIKEFELEKKLLDSWCQLGLKKWMGTSNQLEEISKGLKRFSYNMDELGIAMGNYAQVILDPNCWYSHEFTLGDFITRGHQKFISENFVYENFKNREVKTFAQIKQDNLINMENPYAINE